MTVGAGKENAVTQVIERVLIVDDDPALRAALSGVLDMHGFTTLEADSRKSAISILESDEVVTVIILDLGMPPAVHSTEEGRNPCCKCCVASRKNHCVDRAGS